MKVLLVGRPLLSCGGGGDKIVILKTHEYLKRLGVDAQITFDISPDYKGYDIAHLFTLSTWHAASKARLYGIPFVLSPIYWNPSEAETWILKQKPLMLKLARLIINKENNIGSVFNLVRNIFKLYVTRKLNFKKSFQISKSIYFINKDLHNRMRAILEWASCLMPGSEIEMRHIEENFGTKNRYIVIPHGVEFLFSQSNDMDFIKKYGLKDFILSVSVSFGYRKNQLSLIRALKGSGLSLVIIAGANTKSERTYMRKCKREAEKNILILPPMSWDYLASAYRACRVFALPSLFETPGLVYLEAGVAGCNVVATDRGSAREYLSDFVWYCNPYDVSSIRNAILMAYNAPKSNKLQEYILRNFTWDRAANLSYGGYLKVLNQDIG